MWNKILKLWSPCNHKPDPCFLPPWHPLPYFDLGVEFKKEKESSVTEGERKVTDKEFSQGGEVVSEGRD